MKKTLITTLMAVILLIASAPQAVFADESVASIALSDKKTYYTEESDYISGDCILTATRMMIRRAAILNGKTGWQEITNETVRPVATVDGCLLSSFTFTDEGLSYEVGFGEFKGEGDAARISEFAELIRSHPEGVVVHGDAAASSGMHGALLTDVVDGVPYAMDASNNMGMFSEGIQKWTDTTMLAPSLCTRYWYIRNIGDGSKSAIDDCMSSEDIVAMTKPERITATAAATVDGIKNWKILFRASNLMSIY